MLTYRKKVNKQHTCPLFSFEGKKVEIPLLDPSSAKSDHCPCVWTSYTHGYCASTHPFVQLSSLSIILYHGVISSQKMHLVALMLFSAAHLKPNIHHMLGTKSITVSNFMWIKVLVIVPVIWTEKPEILFVGLCRCKHFAYFFCWIVQTQLSNPYSSP